MEKPPFRKGRRGAGAGCAASAMVGLLFFIALAFIIVTVRHG